MSTFGPVSYNIDINQLGAAQFPRFAVSQPTPYQDALVEDVILGKPHPDYLEDGSNIGMVRVRFIPGDRDVPKEELNWASPLDSSIREYPLKNELVLVFYSLGRLFYMRRINATNKITESSWPGLSQRFSPQVGSGNRSDSAQIAAQGGTPYRPWGMKQQFSLGDEFSENPTVRMVKPFEGDLIIQGRFGNSVRFGSSLFSNPTTPTPQPNLIFSVGQGPNKPTDTDLQGPFSLVQEDINADRTSLWLVSDEEVVLNPATKGTNAHLRSAEISDSTQYTGAQLFLNSNRVILNSKVNEISLFSKSEINLSAVQSITVDSNKSVMMTATKDVKIQAENDILIKGRTISFITTKDISYGTSGNYVISGKKIFIGSGGDESQPMVLGGELAAWLKDLLILLSSDLVQAITTLNPTPYSLKVAQLALKLGATPQGAIFNSTSNFTSKTN